MKFRYLILLAVALMAALGMTALADKPADTKTAMVASVGETAPDFTLMDASGTTHSLSDFRGKFVVLEWINFGCPFVKKHYSSGNMQNLQAQYAKKGVVWLSICSSGPGKQGYFADNDLAAAIADHSLKAAAYLIDAGGDVGRMYQAKTTPNMYIINPDGKLIYAGAIDDKPSVNPEDVKGATNYVAAALDRAMAGKEVAVMATQPYGCSVKYADK